MADALNAAPAADSSLNALVGGLIGVIRSADITLQSAAKLTTGLEAASKAVEKLHTVLDIFTNLLKVPFLEAISHVTEGIQEVITGAGQMAASFAKVVSSIGSGPAAILAAGVALSAATGSAVPAMFSVGLGVEDLGKKMGGFGGQVVFAAGATATATAAVVAAGVAWHRAAQQVFGPTLGLFVESAFAVGLALTPLAGIFQDQLMPAITLLGMATIGPVIAAWWALSATMQKVANIVIPAVQSAWEKFAGWAEDNIKPITSSIGQSIRNKLGPIFESVGTWAKESFGKVGTALVATGRAAVAVVRSFIAMDHVINAVYKTIEGTVGTIAGTLRGMAERGASILRAPMQSLDTAVSAVSANVARFVQLANPASYNQFHMAVNDLYATIGHILTPVLNQATTVFRSLGSALNGLDGSGQRFVQAALGGTAALIAFAGAMAVVETVATGGLAPLVELLAGGLLAGIAGAVTATGSLTKYMDGFSAVLGGTLNALGEVIVAMEPIGDAVMSLFGDMGRLLAGYIQQVAGAVAPAAEIFAGILDVVHELYEAVRPLIEGALQAQFGILKVSIDLLRIKFLEAAPYIVVFVRGIGAVVSALAEGAKQLLAFVGIDLGDFNPKLGQSRNNTGAAATQASTGDIQSVMRKALESAYGAGVGGLTEPQKTNSNLESISKKADRIIQELERLPDNLKVAFADALLAWTPNFNSLGERAAAGVASAASALNPFEFIDRLTAAWDRRNDRR